MAAPVAWTDAFAGLYRWDAEAAIIFVGHLSYALTMDMDPGTVVNLIFDNFVVVLPFADARIQKMLREERAKLVPHVGQTLLRSTRPTAGARLECSTSWTTLQHSDHGSMHRHVDYLHTESSGHCRQDASKLKLSNRR